MYFVYNSLFIPNFLSFLYMITADTLVFFNWKIYFWILIFFSARDRYPGYVPRLHWIREQPVPLLRGGGGPRPLTPLPPAGHDRPYVRSAAGLRPPAVLPPAGGRGGTGGGYVRGGVRPLLRPEPLPLPSHGELSLLRVPGEYTRCDVIGRNFLIERRLKFKYRKLVEQRRYLGQQLYCT